MTLFAPPRWAVLRRQGRLVLRGIRYADATFSDAGRKKRREALETLFRGVNAWLEISRVEHWLVFGTLLGWQREQRILAHDYDVDFGVPLAAYERLVEMRNALPNGFELYDTSQRHGGPKLYVTYRGWEADIYFHHDETGKLWPVLRGGYPMDTVPFPREWVFPLQPVMFLGEKTWIPAEPVTYLKHIYDYIGPNAVRDPVTHYFRPRHSQRPPASPSASEPPR